jgi:putative PEP-CTERM system histidine kinase
MTGLAAAGYALAALLFGVLTALLLTSWRGRLKGAYLVLAAGGSVAWAALMAWRIGYEDVPDALLWAAEPARQLLWLLFLLQVLTQFAVGSPVYARALRVARLSLSSLALVLMLPFENVAWLGGAVSDLAQRSDLRLIGQLLLSVAGMALVEQVLRNTPAERRWGIKHLCIGLGGLFVFDFYLYTDALLFRRVDEAIWLARGAVNAMVVPLLAVSAARNPDWSLPLAVSRRAVFHTTAFFSAGVYMLLMALAGYYIRLYGGEWGRVLQTAFFFGAGIVLVALLLSGQFRARVRVFLSKHFFSYRYDYREEWLRLIGALSGRQTDRPLYERVIWAIAEIVESPAGVLWLCDERGTCRVVASLNLPEVALPALESGHSLAQFLEERHWVVNLHEHAVSPELYGSLQLPDWLDRLDGPWLIVPLIHEDRLRGFVVLMEPRAPQTLNWENLDLLKTAGLQAASYIALHQAADALAEARQFEGFNRLSAFVIHDLKNLIAQLSLVTANAQRHKHNPAFIDDAMRTIENSVAKMTRLMAQMKSATAAPGLDVVDLDDLLRGVVGAHQRQRPAPELAAEVAAPVKVRANPDRLAAVIGHVVQNAQDATPAAGSVEVRLRVRDAQAIVAVRDTGAGMDEAFVRERLFRPFDSTKGLTGMGIGAYECRELVRSLGGHVEVESTPGRGTTFTIVLPVADAQGQAVTP